jgi:oligosaccharyltransferase complex subunit beta
LLISIQTFRIALSEYSRTHYIPFTLPPSDALQLEFSMLSPFHRLNLHPALPPPSALNQPRNSTVYTTTFTTPDQHGIFSFRVNYKRPFLTYIEEKREVTVRHFAHDEWPRSWVIKGAWPWVSGLWVLIVGWVVFVVGWLYCAPPEEETEDKKRKVYS